MADDDEVTISIHVEADIDMDVRDIWPDGDAPEVISADEVKHLMEHQGSKRRVLDDWMLIGDLDISVEVSRPNPAWKQDSATLEGEPTPPRWIREIAQPWTPLETRILRIP